MPAIILGCKQYYFIQNLRREAARYFLGGNNRVFVYKTLTFSRLHYSRPADKVQC